MAHKIPEYIWMNGKLIPWGDAKVHVRSAAFMMGANIFEGLRAYASHDGAQLYIFKNKEHMDRMFKSSMKILRMQLKWSPEDVTRATIELLQANKTRQDVHIRPTVYFGVGPGGGSSFGFDASTIETGCVITTDERPPKPTVFTGINVCVSSWRRINDECMPPRVKAGANYLNSRYIMADAQMNGYQSAIILNHRGTVAEGPGACVMLIRDGKVVTPPVTSGLLESVTRATLIQLFRQEMGLEVVEREVDRTELYVADEVFFCGTGAEVQPVISIDKYPVGDGQAGPIVKEMQRIYFEIARGKVPKYGDWLTPVY